MNIRMRLTPQLKPLQKAKTSRLALTAALAAAAVVPAGRAAAQDPAAIDPVTLMPPATNVFVNINLDAERQWSDSIKDTRLGKRLAAMIASGHTTGGRADVSMAAMMSLFEKAHQVGIGMTLPQGKMNMGADIPDILAVVSGADPTQVRILARAMAADSNWTWSDETVGANVIHSAMTKHPKAGQPLPAYAMVPGALLIGASPSVVRTAVQQLNNGSTGGSFATSAELQAAAGNVDRSQFVWGAVTHTGLARMMTMNTGGAKDMDMSKIPYIRQVLDSTQGYSFTTSLRPDRIEAQFTAAYDPNTEFGKKMRSLTGNPMKAPALVSGRSLFFADVSDMPQIAAQVKDVMEGEMGPLMKMLAGQMGPMMGRGGNTGLQFVEPMMDISGVLVNDFMGSFGNEVALAVGPMDVTALTAPIFRTTTVAMTTRPSSFADSIPPITLLIQKSDNPRLQHWINDFMQLAAAGGSTRWYPTTVLNTPVQIYGAPTSEFRPAYAQIGDFHVVGSSLTALKTPLFLSGGT
ncbi:MAG: hypothetical protein M3Y56_07480, partial [Armatimonadota bacterium]|nr:hypothetical protein [Armatimonadota bacterium]